MTRKLKGRLLACSVVLGTAFAAVTGFGAAATTCDDYSADRFGLPGGNTTGEQTNSTPRGSRPGEDNYIVWVNHVDPTNPPSDPLTVVSIASGNDVGVSMYIHEAGAERAEGALDPGTRPVHFINCKYVAGGQNPANKQL